VDGKYAYGGKVLLGGRLMINFQIKVK